MNIKSSMILQNAPGNDPSPCFFTAFSTSSFVGETPLNKYVLCFMINVGSFQGQN